MTQEAMSSKGVIVRRQSRIGYISLNRPKALHALTGEMCEGMSAAQGAWRDDPEVAAIVLDHAEGRGLCAGGDVARVLRSVLEDGGESGRAVSRDEYRMNKLQLTSLK